MAKVLRKLGDFYGSHHALHLIVVLGSFALTWYVWTLLRNDPSLQWMLVWFVGATIGHDLVLFPVYAFADRFLWLVGRPVRPRGVRVVNYVRVPVLASLLCLALFLPGIIEQGQPTYLAATGQTQEPFFGRWLLVTAVLFGLSALCYVVRVAAARAPRTAGRGSAGGRAPVEQPADDG